MRSGPVTNGVTKAKRQRYGRDKSIRVSCDSRGRVLEEAVVGVEHLLGEQVEPLSGHPAVVEPLLSVKLHPQARLEDVGVFL